MRQTRQQGAARRTALQIAVLAVMLLAICLGCRLATKNTYVATVPVDELRKDADEEAFHVRIQSPEVVTSDAVRFSDGKLRIPIQPVGRGRSTLSLRGDAGERLGALEVRVDRFGTIYDSSTGGFTGDVVVLVAFTVFCLMVALIMFSAFRQARGPAFYAYSTVYQAGFSIMALLTGLMMLRTTVMHLTHPDQYNMLSVYRAITGASWRFVMLTAPMMAAFAVAMGVSNAALLKHEGLRPRNVLGIGASLVLLAGEALAFFLYTRVAPLGGWQGQVQQTLNNVYATAFVYFECMLLGAVICGFMAARHIPDGPVDVILILGCRFRDDGTLTPLLQGRADRAVEYWRQQKQQTGQEALLMPTGGQGEDEPMSEAEAMRRYLLAQGIPQERILVEDRSRNTYQNMEYSRDILAEKCPGARVAYATTNYHVFRSGVWASLAGLRAEGMGSRTRWWYWPNAFMRECASLMKNRIVQELVLLAWLLIFYAALSAALGG